MSTSAITYQRASLHNALWGNTYQGCLGHYLLDPNLSITHIFPTQRFSSFGVSFCQFRFQLLFSQFIHSGCILNICFTFSDVFHDFKSIEETVWPDHSSIGGHRYNLITIGFIHNALIYVISKEWKMKALEYSTSLPSYSVDNANSENSTRIK